MDRLGRRGQADPLVELPGGRGHGSKHVDAERKLWSIKTDSVLANGGKVSSTSVITPVDKNTITWQMKEQKVNGKEIPDTREVKMKRVK